MNIANTAIGKRTDMAERRVTFPIIGDDEPLQKDTRVIYTNQQLIIKNPSLKDEGTFDDAPKKAEKKRSDQFTSYRPKVSYSTQHRPLNSEHNGVSSFDKMPKKTSIDESKERAIRAAATLPKPPKKYVSPLERDKEEVASRRSSSAILKKQHLTNDNPISDMKKQGLNLSDAMSKSGMKQAVPRNKNLAQTQPKTYFENKRKNIFDRGIV